MRGRNADLNPDAKDEDDDEDDEDVDPSKLNDDEGQSSPDT